MSDFMSKMHQIRPRWGSLQHFPRPPSWTKGGLLLRGGMGREGKGGERRRRVGRGGRGGEGRAGEGALDLSASSF